MQPNFNLIFTEKSNKTIINLKQINRKKVINPYYYNTCDNYNNYYLCLYYIFFIHVTTGNTIYCTIYLYIQLAYPQQHEKQQSHLKNIQIIYSFFSISGNNMN